MAAATKTSNDIPVTETIEAPDDLDIQAEEFEITDGEDLFQDGEASGFDGEYEYPLTAFVPGCTAAKDAKAAPAGAALWIIPDLNDVKYLRTLKIFKMTWLEKIPASFNTLYVRPDRENKPNPTTLQRMIISSTVSRYTDSDGMPNISQTVLLPIINLYDGKATPTIGEMTNACYKELVKFNNSIDDSTDGIINVGTRPIYLWREGKGQKTTYGFRFYKGNDFVVKDLLADADIPDVREYVKKRAVATEKWFAGKYAKWQAGELDEADGATTTDTERYIDALVELPTPVIKTVLSEAGLDIAGLRTRQALIDLATAHEELLTDAIRAAQPKPENVGDDE